MAAVTIVLIAAALALTVAAIPWIRTRPADDPYLDRLLLVVSPLLWLFRRTRRRRAAPG